VSAPATPQLIALEDLRDPDAQALLAAVCARLAEGPLALVGSEIDPRLALDWWLRASRLPGLIAVTKGRPDAFALVASPDEEPPAWRRAGWLLGAVRRGDLGGPLRLLGRLRLSAQQRPSAPHHDVPVLLARHDATGEQAARSLLAAVERRASAHPRSLGVCLEIDAETPREWLAALGFRPAARFRSGASRQLCLFRPEGGLEPFPEAVVVPIEDSIDLHRFRPGEIGDVLDGYLEAVWEAGFREVRIIHGRGRGVQRNRVRRRLARDSRVAAFADAPADRGGRGATLVRLAVRSREAPVAPLDRC